MSGFSRTSWYFYARENAPSSSPFAHLVWIRRPPVRRRHSSADGPGTSQGGQAPATQPPPPGGGRGFTPGTESGFATFQTRCTGCHGNPAVERAPSPTAIREMTPERIYDSLTTGSMQAQSSGLTDAQKKALAEFMAGRPIGSARQGDGKSMPNQCATNPAMTDPAQGRGWNGWGNGLANTRFQPAAAARPDGRAGAATEAQVGVRIPHRRLRQRAADRGLRPRVRRQRQRLLLLARREDRLRLLVVPEGIDRPQLADGRRRHRPGRARYAVFFGDGHANVFALDAQTGRQLWKTKVDPHVVARITAGVTYYDGRLFVPVSSSEEFSSGNPDYSVLHRARQRRGARRQHRQGDLEGLGRAGRAEAVEDDAERRRAYKPAGGAVWNAPTIDPVRGAVYVGTGDATTAPPAVTTDAIMAVDINTGKLLWSYQATENDVFMGGCNGPNEERSVPEPDGTGHRHRQLADPGDPANGKRALLAGTKSADVFALDPDNNGALLFRVNAARRSHGGGTRWPRHDRLGRRHRRPARLLRHGRRGPGGACDLPPANARGSSNLKGAASRCGAAPHGDPRRRLPGRSDGRLYALVPPTASSCGSSTPRRSSRP